LALNPPWRITYAMEIMTPFCLFSKFTRSAP
jgi:hypothetical protein